MIAKSQDGQKIVLLHCSMFEVKNTIILLKEVTQTC